MHFGCGPGRGSLPFTAGVITSHTGQACCYIDAAAGRSITWQPTAFAAEIVPEQRRGKMQITHLLTQTLVLHKCATVHGQHTTDAIDSFYLTHNERSSHQTL